MSDKKARIPQIRFAGFTGDWEERKLSNICSMHARIGWQNLRTSEFLNTGDYYLVTGTDFDNGRINFDTCHYVEKERYDQDPKIQIDNGSILITKDGTLGKVALVEGLDKPATLNAGVFNVTIKTGNIDGKYIYQYLKAPFLMDYVSKHATGGTIKHLNQNILVDFPVLLPKKVEEQRKLGELYHNLDNLITLQQRQLDKLASVKKTMLAKMFPKDGANVPEIRFAGFTGAWEERKLGDIAGISSGVMGNTQISTGKYCLTRIETISEGLIDESRIGYTDSKPNDDYLLKTGDILYSNINSISHMGKVAIYRGKTPLYHGINLLKLTPDISKIKPYFLYTQLNTAQKRDWAKKHANKAVSQASINQTLLSQQEMSVCELEEQNFIGSFFLNLDTLLTLHQRELNTLKTLKKSMLQHLFV